MGLVATYDEVRSVLPISVNWTFFDRCVTAEALRANISWKSALSLQRGRLTQNFR